MAVIYSPCSSEFDLSARDCWQDVWHFVKTAANSISSLMSYCQVSANNNNNNNPICKAPECQKTSVALNESTSYTLDKTTRCKLSSWRALLPFRYLEFSPRELCYRGLGSRDSVRPSVRLSHACFVTNPKNVPTTFLYHWKGNLSSFLMPKISAKFQQVTPWSADAVGKIGDFRPMCRCVSSYRMVTLTFVTTHL